VVRFLVLRRPAGRELLFNEHARYFGGYVNSYPQRADGR
jgi:hypothetical protein